MYDGYKMTFLGANGASLNGALFYVTQTDPTTRTVTVVKTWLATRVRVAEIVVNGQIVSRVSGLAGQ
jgi:hypothetical protein